MSSKKSFNEIPLRDIRINDTFWNKYLTVIRELSIPYQWNVLNDQAETSIKSNAVKNFKIAAGLEKGDFFGMVFQDSDVAKWLEAVAYSLVEKRDPELEAASDSVIDLIIAAQQPDGYINTYFTINGPEKRWKNLLEAHELYCAGHLIEAAVAYYQTTGKRKFLDAICKYADLIAATFGDEEGKVNGYPGHQEIELALVKLYEATSEERYLKLSKYFLNQRGKQPHYFDMERSAPDKEYIFEHLAEYPNSYSQSHLPVLMQQGACGHAVRALYMYCGMADIARHDDDPAIFEACKRLWNSIVQTQLYITGAAGSSSHGESFTLEYDLPNDLVYAETCASVGLMMFASRMLRIELDARYADVMEQALYNTVLASIGLDGKHFFYVNPLEVYPDVCEYHKAFSHVRPQRQQWFDCSCCPTNAARTLMSIGKYAYSQSENGVYVHLYIGGQVGFSVKGSPVRLLAQCGYLDDGKTTYTVSLERDTEFEIGFRIPSWAADYSISLNGQNIEKSDYKIEKGYVYIHRTFKDNDSICVALSMQTRIVHANPNVREDIGKLAVARGPLVYCMEEKDNGSGIHRICLSNHAEFEEQASNEFDGVRSLVADAQRILPWPEELYSSDTAIEYAPHKLKLIPYFCWGNRGVNEMSVWIHEK